MKTMKTINNEGQDQDLSILNTEHEYQSGGGPSFVRSQLPAAGLRELTNTAIKAQEEAVNHIPSDEEVAEAVEFRLESFMHWGEAVASKGRSTDWIYCFDDTGHGSIVSEKSRRVAAELIKRLEAMGFTASIGKEHYQVNVSW